MKKNNAKKGFTLMELLIVVAIIAVLVAIAIPVFSGQLEKSREATDAANIRSAYAEVVAASLTDQSKDASAKVEKAQTQDDWQNTSLDNIAGVDIDEINSTDDTTVKYTASTGKLQIDGNDVTTSFINSSSATQDK